MSLEGIPVFFKAVAIFALLAGVWMAINTKWFQAAFVRLLLLCLFLSGLAACFAMIASIIHFQILNAVGYFVVMAVLWWLTALAINNL